MTLFPSFLFLIQSYFTLFTSWVTKGGVLLYPVEEVSGSLQKDSYTRDSRTMCGWVWLWLPKNGILLLPLHGNQRAALCDSRRRRSLKFSLRVDPLISNGLSEYNALHTLSTSKVGVRGSKGSVPVYKMRIAGQSEVMCSLTSVTGCCGQKQKNNEQKRCRQGKWQY